jgi:hypothetical protein
MYSPDRLSPLSDTTTSTSTEPAKPQDTAEYIQAGPGSWQPLGLVIERVIAQLPFDMGGAA